MPLFGVLSAATIPKSVNECSKGHLDALYMCSRHRLVIVAGRATMN